MWQRLIIHEGLHAYRVVRGHTQEEVETKARIQMEAWNQTWKRKQELRAAAEKRTWKRSEWDKQVDIDRRAKSLATDRTKELEASLYIVRNLLMDALTKQQAFDWETLKDKSHFCKPGPARLAPAALPMEPSRSDPRFVVTSVKATLSFIDWIIPGRRRKKISDATVEEERKNSDVAERYSRVHSEWKQLCEKISRENQIMQSEFDAALTN